MILCAHMTHAHFRVAGQEVEVDLEKDVLTVIDSGKQYPLKSIGEVGITICVCHLSSSHHMCHYSVGMSS